MLRVTLFAAGFGLIVFGNSATPGAQCLAFSPTAACAHLGTTGIQADFRPGPAKLAAPAKLPQSPKPVFDRRVPETAAVTSANGIDCAMVRPTDPAFHSGMPIERPHPDVTFAMKVVPVPSCKR